MASRFENKTEDKAGRGVLSQINEFQIQMAGICALLCEVARPEYSNLIDGINSGVIALREKDRASYITYIDLFAGDEFNQKSLWALAKLSKKELREKVKHILQWYCNALQEEVDNI